MEDIHVFEKMIDVGMNIARLDFSNALLAT